jgi:hypothetical protein
MPRPINEPPIMSDRHLINIGPLMRSVTRALVDNRNSETYSSPVRMPLLRSRVAHPPATPATIVSNIAADNLSSNVKVLALRNRRIANKFAAAKGLSVYGADRKMPAGDTMYSNAATKAIDDLNCASP